MKKKIGFLLVFLVAGAAQADLSKSTVFSLNTIYIDRDYDDNGVKSKMKMTDTDFRLMRVEKGWAYGAIYSLSSNDSSDAQRNSAGLSLGYYSQKDFFINLHYYLTSKYKAGALEYSKGNGYEVDVGMLSKVTSSVYIGLLMALKNFSYTEQTMGGVTSSTSATHREVIPMFTLAIAFM